MVKPSSPLAWLLPPRCIGCDEPLSRRARSSLFCADCYQKFLRDIAYGCPSCRRRIVDCRCQTRYLNADRFFCFLPYDGGREGNTVSRLILAGKQKHRAAVYDLLAQYLLQTASAQGLIEERDLLVSYIPRALPNIRRTGIDPAEELTERFLRATGLSFLPLFDRRMIGEEQKGLPYRERLSNSTANYRLIPGVAHEIMGRRILLIDDVVTTGATAGACVTLLREAGASEVTVLAAAKCVYYPDEQTMLYPPTYSE